MTVRTRSQLVLLALVAFSVPVLFIVDNMGILAPPAVIRELHSAIYLVLILSLNALVRDTRVSSRKVQRHELN
jgi:hypothetical protein